MDPNAPAPDPAPDPARLRLRVGDLVAGGAAMGRAPDGRVVLVSGALPGELVDVTVTGVRPRMLSGQADKVVEPSVVRTQPLCPMVSVGCGGCDLQHADAMGLPEMKAAIVTDALRHLGQLENPSVACGPPLDPWAFRTTVRAAVDPAGRAGFRRSRSHDVVVPSECLVVHPLVAPVLTESRFPGAAEVTIRVSHETGAQLVLVAPRRGTDGGVFGDASVPKGVMVTGPDGRRDGAPVHLTEAVAGRSWQISARSFFQSRPDGAAALAVAVTDAVAQLVATGVDRSGTLVDAYSGVGLLAGAVRDGGWSGPMVAVERLGDATCDAEVNLAEDEVRVVASAVEQWTPTPASVVVADPARRGLGRGGAQALSATGAQAVVLVSCDAASLGRDAGLLAAEGFTHTTSVLVDMFPHTHHVEVVSTFVR